DTSQISAPHLAKAFSAESAKSMAHRRNVKLRRGLLLRPLVGATFSMARRASLAWTEVSENRILGSNAYSHCQPVAIEIREAIRTTSMMDDCNARALIPRRKCSIAVMSPRLCVTSNPVVGCECDWRRDLSFYRGGCSNDGYQVPNRIKVTISPS